MTLLYKGCEDVVLKYNVLEVNCSNDYTHETDDKGTLAAGLNSLLETT